MPEEYLNYIDGKWVGAKSGETFENRNPANWDEVIGVFPKSGIEEVNAAVAAAKKAQKEWALVPAPKRGLVLFDIARKMEEKKEEISQLMTREMGKVIAETRGDTQEGIDTGYYAGGEGRRFFGQTTPAEMRNKMSYSIRQPIGVAGMITPWNFPIAIPTWKIFPALLCGNGVVIKPATDTPASVCKLAEILEECGLPPGLVNVVCGSGGKVGVPLTEHPDVGVISFTGSSDVGASIAETCGRHLKRLSLEMGGKNAEIIMEDADLELAVEGALWGAFGTTGQRCTATSRLIVHKDVKKKVLEMLVDKANALKIGNGLDESVDVGPHVNKAQRDTVHGYVQIGKEQGAKLLCGGEHATGGDLDGGWYYKPTIFDGVTPDMRIAKEEIFGPVLSVLTISSLDEAIEVLNNTDYGLSSSIYTKDVNSAHKAIRDIQAGITYINGPTIGAEIALPFGGVKNTGNGHRESGTTVLETFSEWKSVYIDFSGKLQKAQIDEVNIEE